MSEIRIKSIKIKNYRSFGKEECEIAFPDEAYKKPISIIGYNNAGKTNLINLLLYALQVNFVSKDTFTLNDFHNRDTNNVPEILAHVISSEEIKFDGVKKASMNGYHKLLMYIDGEEIMGSKMQALHSLSPKINYSKEVDDENYQAFGAGRYFNIFYINFHKIKEEIQTNKTSWGTVRSLLGKYIQKVVGEDTEMQTKKEDFEKSIEDANNKVLKDTTLEAFISRIKSNFTTNLRMNEVEVEFGLPNYEDVFLQMLFKVGLNNTKQLVPIDHYGDGYISMFVMAVIKAIAEEEEKNKCLFIFEEPESFLHENHQEYFYKTVLCELAENGHQVIYTTHSHKMVDIFDTRGIVRLEFDNEKQQTVVTHNKPIKELDSELGSEVISEVSDYNKYIKSIEPNLNKVLFSNKVILVEGPNDLMVYKFLLKEKVKSLIEEKKKNVDEEKYSETFLNFNNISIITHHGKTTAHLLAELCKFIGVEFFIITDWDIDDENISEKSIIDAEDIKSEDFYENATLKDKKQITINKKLLNATKSKKTIHFNKKNLEELVGGDFGKNSAALWKRIKRDDFEINTDLLPDSLLIFVESHTIIESLPDIDSEDGIVVDDSPSSIDELDDVLPF